MIDKYDEYHNHLVLYQLYLLSIEFFKKSISLFVIFKIMQSYHCNTINRKHGIYLLINIPYKGKSPRIKVLVFRGY